MDSAKAAVADFMNKAGHHDTTVHEKVAPAVTHETINRTQHEEVRTAIDKEVHQDHYHTSVQPVEDVQQMREQHHHNIIPVEHRTFDHNKGEDVERRLAAEQAKFRDQSERVEGQHTSSVAPVVAGEHIHHHVHETIQPVVNKQVIEPHVVHTTVPIHEVHHNAAQHHSTSALPAVSMADFKGQGGVLTGREERYDGFEGEPRSVGGNLGSKVENAAEGHGHHHGHGTHGTSSGITGSSSDMTGGSSGMTGGTAGLASGSSGLTGGSSSHHTGSQMGSSGLEGGRTNVTGTNTNSGIGSNTTTPGDNHKFGTMDGDRDAATAKSTKPSLLDRMNPMKDSDRDGKKGMMD